MEDRAIHNHVNTLLLTPGRWYAWMMLPGYGDSMAPYYSPIYLERVTPLKTGRQLLELTFFNAGYAEGVQGFTQTVRILKHTDCFLVAEIMHEEAASDRAVVISAITAPWIERYCPELSRAHPPTDLATPTDVQAYLTTALRYSAPVRDTGETALTITHPSVLIRINASFTMDLSPLELYEATRGVWRVDARRVERVELAFAVYRGVICEVYRVAGWYPSGTTRYTTRDDSHFKACDPPRMEFEGVIADDVRHLYVGQSVKHYFARGSANPITYVNV